MRAAMRSVPLVEFFLEYVALQSNPMKRQNTSELLAALQQEDVVIEL
jgi:hypothetical protein